MTEPERYRCARCGMSYRVDDPPRKAAVSRCRSCKLIFWHTQLGGTNHVIVGITPRELAQQTGGAA